MCEVDAYHAVVECRIYARPDLSDEIGALSARQLATLLASNVLSEKSPFDGILLDLREAPPVLGPQTRRSVEQWLALAERRGRRVALLVSDSPAQRIQYGQIAESRASTRAKIYVDRESAWRWATEGMP
jgi:hypothetical protein